MRERFENWFIDGFELYVGSEGGGGGGGGVEVGGGGNRDARANSDATDPIVPVFAALSADGCWDAEVDPKDNELVDGEGKALF